MSSDLLSSLELLQMKNYASLIIVTAVVYDYLLTFSSEVDYVWRRSWTLVSTMFILVRYVGLCWAILVGLAGSSFVPGPLRVGFFASYLAGLLSTVFDHRCTVIFPLTFWEFAIFLNAADLVMILRVYAMWNQSKRILCVLLLIYVPQILVSFIFAGVYDNPNTYLSVSIVQITNLSFCTASWNHVPSLLHVYEDLPRFALGTALLILAVIQTFKQSVEMYRATNQWQPSRYMRKLVQDGIIYFLVNVFFNVTHLFQSTLTTTINSISMLLLKTSCYIAVCPAMPRFIIMVREMYEHDLRNHWGGVEGESIVLSQLVAIEHSATLGIAHTRVTSGCDQIIEGNVDESGTNQPQATEDIYPD